ncbi:MAG: hypothetical protein NZT92_02020 [Abditibacteriales bacterium]|nr:hypothetical protein [Abditibacteriales bacterium]MDW8364661.1 hypothetical protein [Abditibacteriales bacterium]
MAATVEMLKAKIARIRQELDEISAMLEAMSTSQPVVKPHPLAGIKFADKEPLRQAFDALFARMGISHVQPIGAEKLQEMMRKAGIKPEDNIFSRGIIEMREE